MAICYASNECRYNGQSSVFRHSNTLCFECTEYIVFYCIEFSNFFCYTHGSSLNGVSSLLFETGPFMMMSSALSISPIAELSSVLVA